METGSGLKAVPCHQTLSGGLSKLLVVFFLFISSSTSLKLINANPVYPNTHAKRTSTKRKFPLSIRGLNPTPTHGHVFFLYDVTFSLL